MRGMKFQPDWSNNRLKNKSLMCERIAVSNKNYNVTIKWKRLEVWQKTYILKLWPSMVGARPGCRTLIQQETSSRCGCFSPLLSWWFTTLTRLAQFFLEILSKLCSFRSNEESSKTLATTDIFIFRIKSVWLLTNSISRRFWTEEKIMIKQTMS